MNVVLSLLMNLLTLQLAQRSHRVTAKLENDDSVRLSAPRPIAPRPSVPKPILATHRSLIPRTNLQLSTGLKRSLTNSSHHEYALDASNTDTSDPVVLRSQKQHGRLSQALVSTKVQLSDSGTPTPSPTSTPTIAALVVIIVALLPRIALELTNGIGHAHRPAHL